MPATRTPTVVLGVDPGLTRCGLGVVAGPAAAPVARHHGCVTTSPGLALEQRLATIHAAVADAIATHRPVLVAVERVLFSRNVRTAMGTGHAAGVVMLAAAQADLPVLQLTPTDVKASVTGDGAADKDAVARMLVAQLGLADPPRPADAADALAVALAALGRLPTLTGAARTGAARGPGTPSVSSWEQVLAGGRVRVAGGTANGDAARSPGARP